MATGVFAGLWDVVSCDSKEKYICRKRADNAQMSTVAPTTAALTCAAEWTPAAKRSVCYKAGAHVNDLSALCWFKSRNRSRFASSLSNSFIKGRGNRRRLGTRHTASARPLVGT